MPLKTAPPHPIQRPHRYVIAGGPGTGKSALLNGLAANGEQCYSEVSRELIRKQSAGGGELLPWVDLEGFAFLCIERMKAQIADSGTHTRAFFDRGLPDVIGYLRHGGVPVPADLRAASTAYAPIVFIAPAWPEIYVNDPERPQTYSDSEALSVHIRSAYLDCGFDIVDLIKAPVEKRVHQVLSHLHTMEQERFSWAT